MKHRFPILLTIFIALLLWQCARRGSPTGGPKDTTAPVLLQSVPRSGAMKFHGKKIRLQFDEFVVTKDVRKQLIISPPMKNFAYFSFEMVGNKHYRYPKTQYYLRAELRQ